MSSAIDSGEEPERQETEGIFYLERRDRASGIETELWDILDEIEDPHLPISLVEMGMIYDVTHSDDAVTVDMTFPCLGCPAYDMIHDDIEEGLDGHDAIDDVTIELVWEPVWSKDLLANNVREKLNKGGIGL